MAGGAWGRGGGGSSGWREEGMAEGGEGTPTAAGVWLVEATEGMLVASGAQGGGGARRSEPRMAVGGAPAAEEAPATTAVWLIEAMEPSVAVGAQAATARI
ncbi:Os07g0136750 [Oryza sativa Japonica Group]|uniref:Os07g0136750 protein n=1 Tax=Oryza sativa subsp. japonica TaxID=39947 RepID=A0A0P0X2B5_ORYSJ|nr:Os07g0136750 [Oryza sativa Japonica Group]